MGGSLVEGDRWVEAAYQDRDMGVDTYEGRLADSTAEEASEGVRAFFSSLFQLISLEPIPTSIPCHHARSFGTLDAVRGYAEHYFASP
jgi:hypothetical protein